MTGKTFLSFAALALVLSGCHVAGGPGPGGVAYRQPAPPVGQGGVTYRQPAPPPGQGGVPPGHGGVPPGQAKKMQGAPVVWSSGGPPPWAPAHGYRKKQRGTYYVYDAPYGISYNSCYRQDLGAALGAIGGAAAGYQVGKGAGKAAAVVGGTIIGMMIGGHIGRSMDEIDQNCIGQILEHAPPQQPITWNNPETGGQYQVTPSPAYGDSQGRYCREYHTTVTIGGQPQQAYGTACRQPDGSWQVVDR